MLSGVSYIKNFPEDLSDLHNYSNITNPTQSLKYLCLSLNNERILVLVKEVRKKLFAGMKTMEKQNIHVFLDICDYKQPLRICYVSDYEIIKSPKLV